MPKGSVVEANNYPLPADVLLQAKLTGVDYVEVPFTYKKGPKQGQQGIFKKWEWNFLVTTPQYEGITVKGNTEPEVNNAEAQSGDLKLARPWYETLLGRQLQLGEPIDTDVLLEVPCLITVAHQEPRPRNDGAGFWFNCEVAEVFPLATAQMDEPPF